MEEGYDSNSCFWICGFCLEHRLLAELDISGPTLKRSTLLGYCRVGRPWADLAGSSPLLVFVLPQMAETIVYVNPSFSLIETDRL
jgi:hypothetical protein